MFAYHLAIFFLGISKSHSLTYLKLKLGRGGGGGGRWGRRWGGGGGGESNLFSLKWVNIKTLKLCAVLILKIK